MFINYIFYLILSIFSYAQEYNEYIPGEYNSKPCPKGYYCYDNKKFPCQKGKFGYEEGLIDDDCNGFCPSGYYCPESSIIPIECGGIDKYCPLGSFIPLYVPDGYYSIGNTIDTRDNIVICEEGYYCQFGIKKPCPVGTYGQTNGLSSSFCNGKCPAGYYCPKPATKYPIPCPEGYYGDEVGLSISLCIGKCQPGYYCPPGSTSGSAIKCSQNESHYCPEGSGIPLLAPPGTYIPVGGSNIASFYEICPLGYFCINGRKELCPVGRFGNTTGLASVLCSGNCNDGYYCPPGSTHSNEIECNNPIYYCPSGTREIIPTSLGYYAIGIGKNYVINTLYDGNIIKYNGDISNLVYYTQQICEKGFYCVNGRKYKCPGTTFGNSTGLSSPSCSGLCLAGYYCPEGSTSSTEKTCGSEAVYCPNGVAKPIQASMGYCTTTGSNITREGQSVAPKGSYAYQGICYKCPPRRYGSMEGLLSPDCSGTCLKGYYCPLGSISATEKECGGPNFYCPGSSYKPLIVSVGYYTTKYGTEPCAPGYYRDFSTTKKGMFDLMITGRNPITINYSDYLFPYATCVKCPIGTFKEEEGDSISLCKTCPIFTSISSNDGRTCTCFRLPFGYSFNRSINKLYFSGTICTTVPINFKTPEYIGNSILSRFIQYPCEIGYYCIGGIRYPCPAGSYGTKSYETSPLCSGLCSAGYYCPLASTNKSVIPCGNSNVYCPEGTGIPIPVPLGYYSISKGIIKEDASRNDQISLCEKGYYCINGLKYICPAGRYGSVTGETSSVCTGICSKGYYCPAASISSTEIQCGVRYIYYKMVDSISKDILYGKHGGSDQICPEGSKVPINIYEGYYSLGNNNITRYEQKTCEPGYFCSKGIKYQCPEGFYGAIEGLSESICSGKCNPGYYCPSYPNSPSISNTQIECGGNNVYCPLGTGNVPFNVQRGFYTTGTAINNNLNTTRSGMKRCEIGYFCLNGIKFQCPAGKYGNEEGLSDIFCSGWCEAGYYCPMGTIDPRKNECPIGYYSYKGASFCLKCPGKISTTQRCRDDRRCCLT